MGRHKSNERRFEHFTQLLRSTMETDAWRALSPKAQALYPWLKLQWKGPKANNNGSIRFSARQAATAMGVNMKTAALAFHELQAKGFIVVRQAACLGGTGEAKSPLLELTEVAMPKGTRETNDGSKLFKDWREGHDLPVVKASVNNPSGRNGQIKPQPKYWDSTVPKNGTSRRNTSPKLGQDVPKNGTKYAV